MAREGTPDIVLMDIKLGGEMDGVTTAEQIRLNNSVPVIYLTAYGNQEVMERAKVTEPYGYILKPFSERELHITIEMALYRHRAETALRESEEKYRLLFDKGPVPLFVLSVANNAILAANGMALEIYGYTEEELLSLHLEDICDSCIDSVDHYHGRLTHLKKNGEQMYVDVTSHRIIILGESAVLLYARDITQRVRAEMMLEHRQKALQGVYRIATTPVESLEMSCVQVGETLSGLLLASGIFVFRINGQEACTLSGVFESNPSNVEMAFPSNELFNMDFQEGTRVSDSDGPFFELAETNVLREMFPHNVVMTVPIVGADSCLAGAITVFGESGRSFGSEDLLIAEIFARYVAHELEREKLSASLSRAEKMEVIGKLSGGVAHEVRNPLNAIMAITDALAKDLEGDPEYAEFLHHMRLQVDRLSALMNDMLDLGKPMERMLFQEENLSYVCGRVMDLWHHSPLHESANVDLVLPADAEEVIMFCDAERLMQVFLNLLENAAQHSPKGAEVIFRVHAPEGHELRIEIVDSGLGVVEDIDRIFEPFYTTRRGGTGLGLSIVKHFIENHKGSVTAINNPEQGVTIEVRLPIIGKY